MRPTRVRTLIKRVIGLPGDVVQTDGNTVYINGKKLKETYPIVPVDLTLGIEYPYAVGEPLVVPPGHLFVLGDNRENSDDGRFWGTLQRSDVVGKYIGTLFHDDIPLTSKTADPPDHNADAAGK